MKLIHGYRRFEKKMDRYYSEILANAIEYSIEYRYGMRFDIRREYKKYICEIWVKPKKYNDDQWYNLFSFFEVNAFDYVMRLHIDHKKFIENVLEPLKTEFRND